MQSSWRDEPHVRVRQSVLAGLPETATAAQVQYNFTVILNPSAATDKQYSFLYSCLQGRGFPLDYVAWADYRSSLPTDQLLAVHGHSSGARALPVCWACRVMCAAADVLCMSSTSLLLARAASA